ncbi:enoyl-ACP reductase FabI [Virgibacillus halodenitrificans]|jgi:enoyl-[acyl-carrier protein] reductase I|uniref:Enoyl-[acyl-carrier-protein] reductase [NADH] n=1 Tax=Virgibacillus halodenitrificans TaxID=1482 RepID=A0AAC9NJQ4_VIRHA|nr:enoyl-ACP reductase FabI [Virgibacillus halodenitrificans]APC46884.1 enoyl-[acyl-carrier-protein] reductase [Virgibacillus halodenitrificans]MBD1222915.1 enoyl-ACP reductase FabI [Virgibacillus halodenitrificans]MCG1027526.1 enoyl-ACP reductase FabI [Virgibacillus halodenitrificans]MCJ0930173.1 enoyl-ACP reductase FabI [Virgibacillus halodenitrificans]MEC2159280.1 enoyl-ACP reductase FabI [Virgibacillus halodenitrificans]
MANLLEGKKIVVMGVASERSIAWGITKSLHNAGANLIFTYRQERSYQKLTKLLEKYDIQAELVVSCDVASDESVQQAFKEIKEKIGVIHGVIHSVAFAKREELKGEYADTSRDGFLLAQEISAYSLVSVTKAAKELMTEGGSIVTQTYLGAERVIQNYNVMGVAKASLEASMRYLAEDMGKYNIRVNAVSAGPIRTLSAKGVSGFNEKMSIIEEKAPLRRNVDQDQVGDATLFFMSELSRGITGEVLHVDSGYHIIGG